MTTGCFFRREEKNEGQQSSNGRQKDPYVVPQEAKRRQELCSVQKEKGKKYYIPRARVIVDPSTEELGRKMSGLNFFLKF